MLDKMFDENYDDNFQRNPLDDEPIAGGVYHSDTALIMSGFKLFQRKFASKNIALQMTLLVIAIIIQIVALTSDSNATTPWMCIGICVALAVVILMRPRKIAKDLENNISQLEGTQYSCIIYPTLLKITTEDDRIAVENGENPDEEIPATLIHLDSGVVEMLEDIDKYLIYIKKKNMYVIPKKAFTDEDNSLIREKLSNIMGIRYKCLVD